jgi:geranylgeranyl diphosphate synthase type II
LKALEFSNEKQKEQLVALFSSQPEAVTPKIEQVKQIFTESGASNATQEAIETYTLLAFATLDKLNITPDKKELLRAFGKNLMERKV